MIKRFYMVSIVVLLLGIAALGLFGTKANAGDEPTAVATADDPVLASNKALLLKVYDIFNTGNVDELNSIVSDDFIDHTPGMGQGVEGLKQQILGARTAFPDINFVSHDLIAEGDKVVSRGTWTGTQTGPFGNVPATGKKVTVSGIDIIRVANGKIAEHWESTDNLGLLQQLGLLPSPDSGASATAEPTMAATAS